MTNKEFLKKVGMELRVAKTRSGLTSVQIAKLTGLHKQTISGMLSGNADAHILNYKRVCDVLGVQMKDIF